MCVSKCMYVAVDQAPVVSHRTMRCPQNTQVINQQLIIELHWDIYTLRCKCVHMGIQANHAHSFHKKTETSVKPQYL